MRRGRRWPVSPGWSDVPEEEAGTVGKKALRRRDHRPPRPRAPRLLPPLPRSGRNDGGTQSQCLPHRHLALGPVPRTPIEPLRCKRPGSRGAMVECYGLSRGCTTPGAARPPSVGVAYMRPAGRIYPTPTGKRDRLHRPPFSSRRLRFASCASVPVEAPFKGRYFDRQIRHGSGVYYLESGGQIGNPGSGFSKPRLRGL